MADRPIRVQRKRTKGWRMPPNTVYVGRPTEWGNRFLHEPLESVELYQRWLARLMRDLPQYYQNLLNPLRGKNLCCWCPLDQPCHADVLLKIANPYVSQASLPNALTAR